MNKLIILFALIAFSVYCETKIFFTRCQLVRELRRQGFPESQLRDWVCIVEAGSRRNTTAIGGPNSDGSYDWGLFYINDRFCSTTATAGKDCNVRCADLLSDDISRQSNCARIIFLRHNFRAWYVWVNKCRGQQLPNISNC